MIEIVLWSATFLVVILTIGGTIEFYFNLRSEERDIENNTGLRQGVGVVVHETRRLDEYASVEGNRRIAASIGDLGENSLRSEDATDRNLEKTSKRISKAEAKFFDTQGKLSRDKK